MIKSYLALQKQALRLHSLVPPTPILSCGGKRGRGNIVYNEFCQVLECGASNQIARTLLNYLRHHYCMLAGVNLNNHKVQATYYQLQAHLQEDCAYRTADLSVSENGEVLHKITLMYVMT